MSKSKNILPALMATGAMLAPNVHVAQAETATPTPLVVDKHARDNEQARREVVNLAHRIMGRTANNAAGLAILQGDQLNYLDYNTNRVFGTRDFRVGAVALSGTDLGAYRLSVTAPVDTQNRLDLTSATAVNIIEGAGDNTWAGLHFQVDQDPDSVRFGAYYQDPEITQSPVSPDDRTVIEAHSTPWSSHYAQLTPERLASAAHQAELIIEAAQDRSPVGQDERLQPAFTQSPDTYISMK